MTYQGSEDVHLDNSEGALNEYCELVERFENRLTLRNLRLVERYRNNDTNLLLHGTWRGAVDFYVVLNGINKATAIGDTRLCPQRLAARAGTADTQTSVWANEDAIHRPSGDRKDVRSGYRDDALVFVQGVEFMENPQRGVPSFVRLEPFNKPSGLGTYPLYFSNRVGFKMLSGAADRKACTAPSLLLVCSNQVANDVIKASPEVVNDISDDCRELAWDEFVHSYAIDALSGLRVYLMDDLIWATFIESFDGRLQLRDVLFGPFDL